VHVILIILALAIVVAAISLVFSFTNGTDWDGPYTLNFKVPKPWQNKPLSFFNEVNKINPFASIFIEKDQEASLETYSIYFDLRTPQVQANDPCN
jgi:hypothetical protein